MKFGKELKEKAVIGWEHHYINYKKLKRVIKKIVIQLREQQEIEEHWTGESSKLVKELRELSEGTTNGELTRKGSSKLLDLVKGAPSGRNAEETNNLAEAKSEVLAKSNISTEASNLILSADSIPSKSNSQDQSKQSADSSPTDAYLKSDARSEFFVAISKDLSNVNSFFLEKFHEFNCQIESISGISTPPLQMPQSTTEPSDAPSELPSGSPPIDTPLSTSAPLSSSQSPSNPIHSQPHPRKKKKEVSLNWDDIENSRRPLFSLSSVHQSMHSITVSNSSQLEARFITLQSIYRDYVRLLSFCSINLRGYRKILKKFDKYACDYRGGEFYKQIQLTEQFVKSIPRLKEHMRTVEELYMRLNVLRGIPIHRSRAILKAINKQVEAGKLEEDPMPKITRPYLFVSFCIILVIILAKLPVFDESNLPAHRCFVLLLVATILWVTEVVPYFVTGMGIPLAVVLLNILRDEAGEPLPANHASKAVFNAMFNNSVILALSGFSISAAFSKCQYELRAAKFLQMRFGKQPRTFLLAFMFLAAGK